MEIHQKFDLKEYNTFGVAAIAAHFVHIYNETDLRSALNYASRFNLSVLILGMGSNLLFTRDFNGLVIQIAWRGIEWSEDFDRVTVSCGENWHDLVIQCLNKGLHGIENLALIPGNVGAAPIQNIGAYGVELSEFIYEVKALDKRTGEITKFDNKRCEFTYRGSFFKGEGGEHFVVTEITLQLTRTWKPNINYEALRKALTSEKPSPQQVFDTVCNIRQSKLPDPGKLGNAGSFFKNPVISHEKLTSLQEIFANIPVFDTGKSNFVKVPAAWLVEKAGWKGRRRGNAAVSTNHALVLVNPGKASGQDILALAQDISSSVQEKFGITLEPEVRLI